MYNVPIHKQLKPASPWKSRARSGLNAANFQLTLLDLVGLCKPPENGPRVGVLLLMINGTELGGGVLHDGGGGVEDDHLSSGQFHPAVPVTLGHGREVFLLGMGQRMVLDTSVHVHQCTLPYSLVTYTYISTQKEV